MASSESTLVIASTGDSVKVTTSTSVSPVPAELVAKFVSGEPIADKQNPFKFPDKDETDNHYRWVDRGRVVLTTSNAQCNSPDEDDNDISTEDVLKESKYVKTYIKNPDKYFELDTDNIKRIQREERKGGSTKPIPVRRRLLNNQPVTVPAPVTNKVTKKRWITNKSHSVYPDLADIKVRVGAASDGQDEEYYNPKEVKFNAAQFDDRFKAVDFGSQDDIDTIAEKTEALDGESSKEREQIITNNLQAAPKNKSYTNTVSSKEFQEYLRAKGLALVPMMRKGKEVAAPAQKSVMTLRNISAIPRSHPQPVITVQPKKPSVFHRLLSRSARGTPSINPSEVHSPQVNQRMSAPAPQFNHYRYSNGLQEGELQRQRHSTPLKSTREIPRELSDTPMSHRCNTIIVADNDPTYNNQTSIRSTQATPREPIYESTDRLQNLLRRGTDNNGVVLRNPQPTANQVTYSKVNGHPQSQPPPQQQQLLQKPQRSMPRNEIYAHLYAFYQKSKRNSVSSVEPTSPNTTIRSQSRNSG